MKLKSISIVALLLAGVITVISVVSGMVATQNQYDSYIAKARKNAEREIPYTAVSNYRSAFTVKCEDEAVFQEYLAQAKILGEDFYRVAVDEYVTFFPESPQAYEERCTFFYTMGSYKTVVETATEANQLGLATEKVRDMYLECFYMTDKIRDGLSSAQSFLGSYARVEVEGLYGYIKNSGTFLLAPFYQEASPFMSGSAAVYDGTEWYMINTQGYKVAKPTGELDSMSFLTGGFVRVEKDGKYAYMTSALTVPEKLPFDYASVFKNGVAAVRKDGKWALINTGGEYITELIYEDILLDEFDSCINGGVIFAKFNGKYIMLDAEGNQIGSQTFDDAYPFAAAAPAAVCIGGKWGFVDTEGNMVVEPQYEAAKSFNVGLGAVCVDGKWGYINSGNTIRIEPQYQDCLPFASCGIAAVKENDVWGYIQLLGYE